MHWAAVLLLLLLPLSLMMQSILPLPLVLLLLPLVLLLQVTAELSWLRTSQAWQTCTLLVTCQLTRPPTGVCVPGQICQAGLLCVLTVC
jgi:hypothetical protein